MDYINLSINSIGNHRYRFAITVDDSAKYFQTRGKPVLIRINDEIFFAKTTCGQIKFIEKSFVKFKKGFDLYSIEISDFIILNQWENLDTYFQFRIHNSQFRIKF